MTFPRDDFFAAASALPREEVRIPRFADPVFVHTMTAGERDRYDVAQADAGRGSDFRARLVVATARDADGNPLFTDADLPAVSGFSCAVVDRLVEPAMRLNRFTKADVEELAKNSASGPA